MKMFYLEIRCPNPNCKKSLQDEEHLVRNKPSLHLIVEKNGVYGDVYLSAFYDDYKCIEPNSPNILPGDIVRLFCPHCGNELPKVETCFCKAPQVRLNVEGNGYVKICTRKGCKCHALEFTHSESLNSFIERMRNNA